MNATSTTEYEVVGLNGEPAAGCGRLLPVIHRRADNQFTVWGAHAGDPTWASEDQFEEMLVEERWSRFREPLAFPERCQPTADSAPTPMVIFAANDLIASLESVGWPTHYRGELLPSTQIEYHQSIRASCVTASTVEDLLDDWAVQLIKRFDRLYPAEPQSTTLKSLADYILDAARLRDRRYQGYLRLALTQEPDKVARTFRSFTHREFPATSLDQFLVNMAELNKVLNAQAPVEQPNAAMNRATTTRRKLHNITQQTPVPVTILHRPAA